MPLWIEIPASEIRHGDVVHIGDDHCVVAHSVLFTGSSAYLCAYVVEQPGSVADATVFHRNEPVRVLAALRRPG